MKIVPHLLYTHKNVNKIMVDGLSCIVHKTIDTIDTDTDHYVASHVISIVLKGKLKIKTHYEGEYFMASENQVIFIPKGRYMISDIIPKNGEFEAVFFFFEEELLIDFYNSQTNQIEFAPNDSIDYILEYSNELRVFTETILYLYQNKFNEYKALTKLKLTELLHLLYHSNQRKKLIAILYSIQNLKKRNIEELMLLNFDKMLTIEDYAYLSGRSISSFRRDFKRQFNQSPKKWLVTKRLEKAKQLLQESDLPIHEIAFQVGYENTSHFINIFGKAYHLTPKQFLIKNRIQKKI